MFSRTESFSEYIRFYPVISILIALNIFVHLVTMMPGIGKLIFFLGMGINGAIEAGEWWRLITPIFLHGGFMHLFFNMFSLFVFGPELEKILGRGRFLFLFMLSGIIANVLTYFIHPPDYSHVGASGAIYGIFGAYAALVYYTKNQLPELRQVIVPIIIIGVIMTFVQPNINITGHLGGLLAGFVIGLSFFNPKRIARLRKRSYR